MLSKLDHPNIIKPIEAFEDDHKIYFVIDELKGLNLQDKIFSLKQELTEEEVAILS